MNGIAYLAGFLAAFLHTATAFPSLWDSLHLGCEVPTTGFGAHAGTEANEEVTISILKDEAPVTEFTPGSIHTIQVPTYTTTPVNVWIHASVGTMGPGSENSQSATSCSEAAFSLNPATDHTFEWTAPDNATEVIFSVSEANGPLDPYQTITLTMSVEGSGEEAGEASGTVSALSVATGVLTAVATAFAALAQY